MEAVAVGGFQDEQVAGVGRIGVRQDGRVGAAEVAGEEYFEVAALIVREGEEDETGAEDVTGVFEFEGYSLFEFEGFVELEAPGEVVDEGFEVAVA